MAIDKTFGFTELCFNIQLDLLFFKGEVTN